MGARHFGESAFKCIVVESEEFLILNPYVKNIMIEDEWFEHYDYEYPTLAQEEEQRDDAKLREDIVNKYTDPKLTPVEKPEKPERDDFPEGEDGDEEFEEAMEEYEEKLEEYNKYLEDLLENYKILKDFGATPILVLTILEMGPLLYLPIGTLKLILKKIYHKLYTQPMLLLAFGIITQHLLVATILMIQTYLSAEP